MHFHLTAGPPAHIGKVAVRGSPGYTEREIEELAHLHPGSEVSAARLTGALQHLRKSYQAQRRLEAQIAVAGRIYHAEDNTLDYLLAIEDAGFLIERAREPRPRAEDAAERHDLTRWRRIPLFLMLRAVKPT